MSGRRSSYDAVVVGARCAGSPLAARLAEGGWSVLLVDREPPPADTLSTHCLFPNTMANLRDALSRRLRPRSDVFTDERLGEWFASAAVS
jgi:choline dehydrogenase-like flavoprotein